MLTLTLALLFAAAPAIDNDFVVVTRSSSACAAADGECGDRVVVALSPMELESAAGVRHLQRGDVAVFRTGEAYAAAANADWFEVRVRPGHPEPKAPAEQIAPEKNEALFDAEDFFVFAEKLSPGDTRARHSHSQRVVIQLNRTRLQQWPDGSDEIIVETVPERPSFSPAVIHKVKNLGDVALFGVIVEFKPRMQR